MQKNNQTSANLDFLKTTFKTLGEVQPVQEKKESSEESLVANKTDINTIKRAHQKRTEKQKTTVEKTNTANEAIKINAFIKKDIYDKMLKLIYEMKIDGDKNISITRVVNEGIGLFLKKYASEE